MTSKVENQAARNAAGTRKAGLFQAGGFFI